MSTLIAPFYPIIYVRGYAMTEGEIANANASPYMGFNLGSTRIRQSWDKKIQRHVFESPLIRLMKDYDYRDCFSDGAEQDGQLPARSIIIYRYYDNDAGDGENGVRLSVTEAAAGLKELIHAVREQVCGDDAAMRERFRVYLVAHSMGGLIVRTFLQNDGISTVADRALVDKVFTYATPHNGIEIAGVNVPGFLGLWDINNFNRKKMAGYLSLPAGSARVDSLGGKFDPQRFSALSAPTTRTMAPPPGCRNALREK